MCQRSPVFNTFKTIAFALDAIAFVAFAMDATADPLHMQLLKSMGLGCSCAAGHGNSFAHGPPCKRRKT